MSLLFDRVPRDQLGTRYTHRGTLAGVCPVYMTPGGDWLVTEVNGVPRLWFELVFSVCGLLGTFPLVIHGRLQPQANG